MNAIKVIQKLHDSNPYAKTYLILVAERIAGGQDYLNAFLDEAMTARGVAPVVKTGETGETAAPKVIKRRGPRKPREAASTTVVPVEPVKVDGTVVGKSSTSRGAGKRAAKKEGMPIVDMNTTMPTAAEVAVEPATP